MSLNVGNNTSNYLSSPDVVASYPFAVGVWFKRNSTGVEQMLWSSQADSDHFAAVYCGVDDNLHFAVQDAMGNADDLVSSAFGSIPTNFWTYVLVVAISATERYIYPFANDTMETSTVNRAISAFTASSIGNGLGVSCDGLIAEVTVWEDFPGNPFASNGLAALGGGVSPLFYNSLLPYLKSYVNLFGHSQPTIGPAYTTNGTLLWSSDGPRLYLPSGMRFAPTIASGAHLTDDVSDPIALLETIPVVVGDTISLEEIIFNSRFIYVVDTISMQESIFLLPEGRDALVLHETITTATHRERDLDDDLALFETIQAFVNADCPTCCDDEDQYHPFIGTSTDTSLPTPPSQTPPTLTPSHSIVLSWPYVSPSLTVTLRAPEFGNKDSVENKRVRRASRGGNIHIYADPQWPKIYRLQMDFAALTEQVAQDYLTFRQQTLGKQVKLVDHESRVWKGVITDADTPITRNSRNGATAGFVFEGELQ